MRSTQISSFSSRFLTYRTVLLLGCLAMFGQSGKAADALNYFKNYFVTGDYAVAGVGLRGNSVNGFASGNITVSGVPAGADIVAAFAYWETEESAATPAATNGFFDGNAIVGKSLGNPLNPSCSSPSGSASGRVYRADILRYLAIDQTNNVRIANGQHTIKVPGNLTALPGNILLADGATMVIVYRLLTPGTPLKGVVIYDGTYTLTSHTAAMTQTMAGFYQTAPGAKMTQIVANGQPSFSSTTLKENNNVLSTAPFLGAQGTRWDNPTFPITLDKNASAFTTTVTTSNANVCLTWGAILASTNVVDTDSDGLLDIWETKGLHFNPKASPATFGGCSDYPAEACVNLPAMGASPTRKDIFVEIDWLQGVDGHVHMPKLAALNAIGATFASHSIQLHFDVGNNYQQSGSPYLVPAAYGQGGEVIQESLLLCPNAATKVCAFPNLPYSVQSWKIGFLAVKEGFPALGIPAHFADNRNAIFHYALFSHALGIPYSPPTGLPKSISGVADRPGGDLMVSLGLWRSDVPADDQTGSQIVQAGTLMHELGHNLGLSHAGLYRLPNCEPNYLSVMNYMYQARGLTDGTGGIHVDYSYGLTPPLNENSLSPNDLGTTPYRVRYYGPLAPPASPAKLHCDGTPITDGSLAVRLESPIGPIDWANNAFSTPGPFALDVNFNGFTGDPVHDSVDPTKIASDPTKRWMVDSNDWANLNLQQIGARLNAGGLSSDIGQADLGQADLGQADLGQADLGQADLGQADLGQADLGQADLGQADLGDVDFLTVLSSLDATSSPLTATSSLTGVTLNWGAPTIGQIRHYNIYRSDPANLIPTPLNHVDGAPPATTYTDTVDSSTTQYNIKYTYVLTAVDINGNPSNASNTASAIVKHLFIKANDKTRLYGDPNPAFDFVTTGQDPGLTGTPVCTTAATQTSNVGNYPITCSGQTPAAGVTYTAGTLTINPAPLSITAVTNTKTYDGTTSAAAAPLVSALKNADTITGVTETYSTSSAGTGKTLSISAYTISDGNNGNNYTVTTTPINTGVINPLQVTGVITAANKTYDGLNTATITNCSVPGVLSIDTANATCVASGATFASPNAGTQSVTANVALTGSASGNYVLSSATATTTATINKAPLTVTAVNAMRTYGAPNPTFTVTYLGLVNNELPAVLGGTLSCVTPATPASPVPGSPYAITCSGLTSNNYAFTYVGGLLTVLKATLAVNADPQNRFYGDPNPALTASFVGFQNGETLATSGVTGNPTLSTAAIATTPSGGYPIVAGLGTLAASNYTFAISNGVLTVNKAPLTLKADNKTRRFNNPNGTFVVLYSGFKNGETLTTSDVTGSPSVTTTATLTSKVGQYPITVATGTMVSNDYTFVFVSGTLTITP